MANKKPTLNEDGELIVEKVETKKTIYKKPEPSEYVFKLIDAAPMHYFISNEAVLFDESTGKERTARYLEGVSTIWMDEQKDVPPSRITKPVLQFIAGVMRVPATKKTLLEFLMANENFDGKKTRLTQRPPLYTLINNEKNEEEAFVHQQRKFEAMQLAFKAEVDEMVPHAQYLGVSFVNQYGLDRTVEAIRSEYVAMAEQKPDEFLKTYDNPIVKAKYFVDKALSRGVISTSIVKGQAHWAATKSLITTIPIDQEPSPYLANFCFKEDGKAFYERLKEMVG